MPDKVVAATVQGQAAQSGVLLKLFAFAIALAIAPIASYFASLWYLFNGNTTYAAITAIFAANIVLVSYIAVAVLEDSPSNGTAQAERQESKKLR